MRLLIGKICNIFLKPLLKSPLHWLVSSELLLITFTGHKSGRTYSTPVQYKRDGKAVIFVTGSNRRWWRNLQSGAPVTVRIKGRDIEGVPEIVEDRASIEQALMRMSSRVSPEQIAELVPRTVLVRIYLRQPELVAAH
jgi:deazaflavin-dependent oxidoreductase (nitroreductase family)